MKNKWGLRKFETDYLKMGPKPRGVTRAAQTKRVHHQFLILPHPPLTQKLFQPTNQPTQHIQERPINRRLR